MNINDDIKCIKGIGPKAAANFAKLGIKTVGDLLMHYPRDYESYAMPVAVNDAYEGEIVTIQAGIVRFKEIKRVKNLNILNCIVSDPTGSITLTWYNQPYLKNSLKPGIHYVFRGKAVRKGKNLEIIQPKIYTREQYLTLMNTLSPVYPLTEGITNNAVSKAVKQALGQTEDISEYIPSRIIKEYSLIKRKAALEEIHFPKSRNTMLEARKRLVFDEFFTFTIALMRIKENKEAVKNMFDISYNEKCDELIASLPYELTKAQKNAFAEVVKDMTGQSAMNRLIQGDVGSGKTIIAVLSLMLAALNGLQGCLMVPTEVLANQHYEQLLNLLEPYGINTVLLTGSLTVSKKREVYEAIKEHRADIIVGTHALIQENVEYDRLGLVITDEQHRFGVMQRQALFLKGLTPHVLVMSATPIPRTLAIILYGDLDISVIDELPAERIPIKNCVVDTGYRPAAFKFIEKQVQEGRQAYVICPMVEESENIEAENVVDYTQMLKEELSSDIRTEYLHGRMKAKEKAEIMERFAKHETDVLVSTTVIEVGVNVPNATVMMVENAERFGLAQLHQLRGRVGRGKWQSYCILVCQKNSKDTMERLSILNKSNDGFFIAEEDLKLRGPGDLFGIRQSGALEFRLGDIYNDASVLKAANDAAKSLKPDEYIRMLDKIDDVTYYLQKEKSML